MGHDDIINLSVTQRHLLLFSHYSQISFVYVAQ